MNQNQIVCHDGDKLPVSQGKFRRFVKVSQSLSKAIREPIKVRKNVSQNTPKKKILKGVRLTYKPV